MGLTPMRWSSVGEILYPSVEVNGNRQDSGSVCELGITLPTGSCMMHSEANKISEEVKNQCEIERTDLAEDGSARVKRSESVAHVLGSVGPKGQARVNQIP